MSQNELMFNVSNAEQSGRLIRSQSDKFKRVTDKLRRGIDGSSSWWIGDSRNGFMRRANELTVLMGKVVDLVADLGEDMLAAAAKKKEDEELMKRELLDSLTVKFGDTSTGAASGTSTGGDSVAGGFSLWGIPVEIENQIVSSDTDEVHEKTHKRYNFETGEFEEGDPLWEEGEPVLAWEAGASIDGSLVGLEGEVSGKNDFAEGSASISVLHGEAYAGAGAGIYAYGEDGNKVLAPGVHAEIGGSISVLHGEAEGRIGSEMAGLYGEAEVSAGKVEAELGLSAGIFYEDGKYKVDAYAGASAEAIAVEATGEAGVSILGTDIGVTGGVNIGVGAHAEGGFKDGKLKGDLGISFGIGVSVGFEIDVSGTVDAVKDAAVSAWNWFTGG